MRVCQRGYVQTALPATPEEQQRLLAALTRALPLAGVQHVTREGDRVCLESELLRPVENLAVDTTLPFVLVTRGWVEVRPTGTGLALAYEVDFTAAAISGTAMWAFLALIGSIMPPLGVGAKVALLGALWVVFVPGVIAYYLRGIRRFFALGDELRWALRQPGGAEVEAARASAT